MSLEIIVISMLSHMFSYMVGYVLGFRNGANKVSNHLARMAEDFVTEMEKKLQEEDNKRNIR